MLTRITRTPGAALASILLEAERHGSTQARTLDALALATGSTARDLGAIVRGARTVTSDDLEELAAVAVATKQSTGALCYGAVMRAGGAVDVEEDEAPRYRFRMSTADVDRAHDIVDQVWRLDDFNANPVALWAHRTDTPAVGVWRDVQVTDGGLSGDLVPAPIASYPLSMTVAEQLRQGVLCTVSVGFLPGVAMHRSSFDPEDERHSRRGVWFSSNALIECTLTPVPMNQAAVRMPDIDPDAGDATEQRSAGVLDWLITDTERGPSADAWDWLK